MRALILLFAVALSGCTVNDIYVAADRATYDVVAPAYSSYVSADEALTPEQKERRFRLISSWLIRISKAEQK